MQLNDLHPAAGSHRRRKRVGRGAGSGQGKTAGRGHKGQHSRSGSGRKAGFEGGQMPLQRRLPKFGFVSHKAATTGELKVGAIGAVAGDVVDLPSLKQAGLVRRVLRHVKLIAGGEPGRAVTVRGLSVSRGARAAIEQAGGTIEV